MENKNSYTIVGLVLILAIILLVVFILWLTALNNSNSALRTYYIISKELPKGLELGSKVSFLGVPAGSVSDITFSDINGDEIIIALALNKSLPILDNSLANVDYNIITGMSNINIIKGKGKGELFPKYDKKPILHLEGNFLNVIGKQAENITESADDVVRRLGLLLSKDNLTNIAKILEHSDNILSSTNREDLAKKINEILESINSTLASLDTKTLNTTIKNINLLALQSTKTLKNLDKSLELINKDLQKGDYNLKKILNPALYQSQSSLIVLSQFITDLKAALFQFENNPYNFIFSSPQEKKGKK